MPIVNSFLLLPFFTVAVLIPNFSGRCPSLAFSVVAVKIALELKSSSCDLPSAGDRLAGGHNNE